MEIIHLKELLETCEVIREFMKKHFKPLSVKDLTECNQLESEYRALQREYEDFLAQKQVSADKRTHSTFDELNEGLRKSNAICEALLNRLEELNELEEMQNEV